MFHYVYRITNISTKKHYYGCRTSKVCPSADLGVKYFSSSTDVDFIKEQKTNPKNFKYKVIFITMTRQAALALEIKLHNRFNVRVNECFYNKANQTSTGFTVSPEVGKKISAALKGRPNHRKGKTFYELFTHEHAEKLINNMKQRYISDETREKQSRKHIGKKLSESHKAAIGRAQIGRQVSLETREKSRNAKLEKHHTRNKTYEEYYGEDRATEIKQKLSLSHKGKKHTEINNHKAVNIKFGLLNRIVYQMTYLGEIIIGTSRYFCNLLNITIDTFTRLVNREIPKNKSQYTELYSKIVELRILGKARDVTVDYKDIT